MRNVQSADCKIEESKLNEQGPCNTVTLTIESWHHQAEWIGVDAILREAIERADA